ncbi:hypothetical protein T439DRAFT_351335 [Meredithblackwellia eburnea MCA 4105]
MVRRSEFLLSHGDAAIEAAQFWLELWQHLSNLLSPPQINPLARSLLAKPSFDQRDQEQQQQQADLKTPIEAAALLSHAIHTAVGFRLVDPPPVDQNDGADDVKNKLPSNWIPGGSSKLKYRHEQSSLEFVVSVVEIGGRGMVAAVAVEDNKSVSFDFLITDYFSSSAFPATLSTDDSFASLFSSPTRETDLITLYRLNVLQPLIPGLRKDGYTELPASASSTTASSSGSGASGSGAANRGRVGSPTGPYYPDAGGPMGMYPQGGRGGGGGIGGIGPFNPPSRGGGFGGGVRDPFNIGRSDLDPLGGRSPQFPGFPGTAGPSFGGGIGGGGGGGMFMGPDHPLFRERFGDGGRGGSSGVWGGDGFLPQGAVPPGARFDPVGPSNGPPQAGGVGIGGFGGGQGIGSFTPNSGGNNGGGGGPVRSHDPDWDEHRPPGSSSNDYDAMFG